MGENPSLLGQSLSMSMNDAAPVIHQVLKEKRQVNMVQQTNIGKTLLVTATPVFQENGKLDMVVQNARDITQLEVIKQELEKVNRLVLEYREDVNPRLESDLGTFGLVGQSQRFKELISFATQIAPINSIDSIMNYLRASNQNYSYIKSLKHVKLGMQ